MCIKEADVFRVLETRLQVILDDPSKQREIVTINELLGSVKKPMLD